MRTHTEPSRNSRGGYEQDSERVRVHLGSLLSEEGRNDGSEARSEEKVSSSALHQRSKYVSVDTL